MSLIRRNLIAWALLAAASLSWFGAQQLLNEHTFGGWTETVAPTEPPPEYTQAAGMEDATQYHEPVPEPDTQPIGRFSRTLGFLLAFFAAGAAAAAIFFLPQKAAVCGPDGCLLLFGLAVWVHFRFLAGQTGAYLPAKCLLLFTALFCIRSLWGWMLARCRIQWCGLHRLSRRCAAPQTALGVLVGVTLLMLTAGLVLAFTHTHGAAVICVFGACMLCLCCVRKFAMELQHLARQLEHFRSGESVIPGDGTFAPAERQLLQIQQAHTEAVRTAVANERFKVELIANVSHDLRTPLTSILGYGELLQSEDLSPAGQEKLSQLNRKAGYMRDLVDSLFELTKVSSGVLESKREAIDLIRLLEQTIGLFDDKLTVAAVQVRRRYEADTMPVVTDGARMHQVFANLLGNAIKYAMPGTRIYLQVSTEADSCQVRLVNTASYDMDFTPDEILQRFARGDKARSTQGSGLGLAIAQTYTESVGGEFRIQTDGDQFIALVNLPL